MDESQHFQDYTNEDESWKTWYEGLIQVIARLIHSELISSKSWDDSDISDTSDDYLETSSPQKNLAEHEFCSCIACTETSSVSFCSAEHGSSSSSSCIFTNSENNIPEHKHCSCIASTETSSVSSCLAVHGLSSCFSKSSNSNIPFSLTPVTNQENRMSCEKRENNSYVSSGVIERFNTKLNTTRKLGNRIKKQCSHQEINPRPTNIQTKYRGRYSRLSHFQRPTIASLIKRVTTKTDTCAQPMANRSRWRKRSHPFKVKKVPIELFYRIVTSFSIRFEDLYETQATLTTKLKKKKIARNISKCQKIASKIHAVNSQLKDATEEFDIFCKKYMIFKKELPVQKSKGMPQQNSHDQLHPKPTETQTDKKEEHAKIQELCRLFDPLYNKHLSTDQEKDFEYSKEVLILADSYGGGLREE